MLIITSTNDLEFRNEYDLFKDVYYNQKPFTGLLKDENEETEYVNGNAHGKYIVLFEDGSTHTEAFFLNGDELESVSFYNSGQKLSEQNQTFSKLWNEDGQLISESDFETNITKTYFLNGNVKSIYDRKNEEWTTKYFTKSGALVLTQLADKYIVDNKVKTIYGYDALLNNYFDLLNNDYPEFEFEQSYQNDESHRIHLIWMWFWDVFEKDKKQYFEIVNNLIKHPNRKVLESIATIIAIHRFEPYIETENEQNRECYALIKSDSAYQDKYYPNRDYKKVVL